MAVMDLDLRRLRYFVTVAEELSFVRAATLLHMTQPALSRQISALERDLGARLLERDRRGTALTPAGQQLLNDAIPLLAASSELEQRTRLAGRGPARFVVGFMPGLHATALPGSHPVAWSPAIEESLERVALGAGVSCCPRASGTSTGAPTSAMSRCGTWRPAWWPSPTTSTAPCRNSASSPNWPRRCSPREPTRA
jgi:Bacterial regulatory helix-turn-helix protein, lysR family